VGRATLAAASKLARENNQESTVNSDTERMAWERPLMMNPAKAFMRSLADRAVIYS
jgi:hypothetical protein